MGKLYDKNEIKDLPAYKLQALIPQTVDHLFFFGAGASYGSDGQAEKGELPPLGKDLFQALHTDSTLESWNKLPDAVVQSFNSSTFEEAMDFLDESKDWAKKSFKRDLDLSRFFSKFHPQQSNLYWKLAQSISRRLKGTDWTGAIITINYDRLIEESFMLNSVFTVVNGVTFFDDAIPHLNDNQLIEVCYPHGACQFFLGQNWFTGSGNIVFGKEAKMLQKGGVNHILKYQNIPKACELKQIPMICRYQSSKRPSVNNYFIDVQQARCTELIISSEKITIVGVLCSHKTDRHIWEALEKTLAFLTYVEPGKESQESFHKWAKANNKKEDINFQIIPKTFKDAFPDIRKINELE
jgi:hypothetical protein